MFAQQRYRLMTHFSEHIPIVKRCRTLLSFCQVLYLYKHVAVFPGLCRFHFNMQLVYCDSHAITLKSELSSSAWLILRFVPPLLFVVLASLLSSAGLLVSSFFASEGLRAPNKSKLILANRNCSSTYGRADSLRFPITCLAISKAASCCKTGPSYKN